MDEMPKIWVPSNSESPSNVHRPSYFSPNIFLYPLNLSEGFISIRLHFGFVFYRKYVDFSYALKHEKRK